MFVGISDFKTIKKITNDYQMSKVEGIDNK